MRYTLITEHPRTFAVIFNSDDELAANLKQFALDQQLSAASFKAIGALSSVQLAWFNWATKKYETSVQLEEQVELLSMIGDIAESDGKPQVHAHVIVGKSDGTAHGGHLQKAVVRPTCEVILTESPEHLRKKVDPESGIALIRI
jgi:hypothetical protein